MAYHDISHDISGWGIIRLYAERAPPVKTFNAFNDNFFLTCLSPVWTIAMCFSLIPPKKCIRILRHLQTTAARIQKSSYHLLSPPASNAVESFYNSVHYFWNAKHLVWLPSWMYFPAGHSGPSTRVGWWSPVWLGRGMARRPSLPTLQKHGSGSPLTSNRPLQGRILMNGWIHIFTAKLWNKCSSTISLTSMILFSFK